MRNSPISRPCRFHCGNDRLGLRQCRLFEVMGIGDRYLGAAVGYGRLEGLVAAQSLARLYAAARLHGNLFQPSFKLKEKKRIGARVIKRYHTAEPPIARRPRPCRGQRGQQSAAATAVRSGRSRAVAGGGPSGAGRARRAVLPGNGAGEPAGDRRRSRPLRGQPQDGVAGSKRRPTHRRPYRRRKPIPQRPSMLDEVWDQIQAWLDREPMLSAVEILRRLKTADAAAFSDKHLRTVQRAVKAWRSQQARRIIAESAAVIVPGAGVADLAMPEHHAETGRHRAAASVGF
jgi:hypothetical protein